MSRERYDELLNRDDTAIKIEKITLPAEPLDVITFTNDETRLTITTEMGIESRNIKGGGGPTPSDLNAATLGDI